MHICKRISYTYYKRIPRDCSFEGTVACAAVAVAHHILSKREVKICTKIIFVNILAKRFSIPTIGTDTVVL
jgi:hypothetical protein